jgi:hypothetical protein
VLLLLRRLLLRLLRRLLRRLLLRLRLRLRRRLLRRLRRLLRLLRRWLLDGLHSYAQTTLTASRRWRAAGLASEVAVWASWCWRALATCLIRETRSRT